MRIDILTIFPEFFESPLRASLLGKAIEEGRIEIELTDIRSFSEDPHHKVDDSPYGGGPGMVMKCEPLYAAVESLRDDNSLERVIMLSPKGRPLTQAVVRELAKAKDLVFICGRYEGVDERVRKGLCTDEISLGDYVLSGGEVAALAMVEAISRMLPGVVGDWESVTSDSFYSGVLGPPQFTRPASFKGMEVPEILLNGNHGAIETWRRKEALRATREGRPDLLEDLSATDRELLSELERE